MKLPELILPAELKALPVGARGILCRKI